MYNSAQEFTKEYTLATNAAQGFHGVIPQTKAVTPQIAWDAYSNARTPNLGFHLFGRHINAKSTAPYRRDQNPVAVAASKGPTLGQLPKGITGISLSKYDEFTTNFGVVNNTDDGSILMMGGSNWNLTVNDSWLLGGVHSELPFYACSPLKSFNLFDHEYILTITGRELLGMALAGYVVKGGHQDLGMAFISGDSSKAKALSLPDIQVAVSEIKSVNDAFTAMTKAGYPVSW